MKRHKLAAMLVAALALCFALVGCGGAGGGGADPTKTFLGTWDLAEASDATEDDIAMMKAFGIYCYLDFMEDDKVQLNLMGEPLEGTWEAKSATECSVTLEGETVTATLKDDLLTMEQDGEKLSFKKLSDEDAEQLKNDASASLGNLMAGGDDDEETVEEIGQQLVSDDICTIDVVNKKTDWAGDPGFTLKITNNSDKSISISPQWGSFSVNGGMTDPSLYETIKPGAYVETFLWFDQTDVADLASLTTVEGTLEVSDADTYDTLATYPFSM